MKKTGTAQRRQTYLHEFYRNNHIHFITILFSLFITVCSNLAISWLLQALVDTCTGAQSHTASIPSLIWVSVAAILSVPLAELIRAWAQPRFLSRAMTQYKELVFSRLMQKNIASFNSERTSTYISALSNDLNTIETNYLRRIFSLFNLLLLFVGAAVMMILYSPLLFFIGLGLSLLPIVASLLAGGRLAAAEKTVSDRNESLLSTLKDSLTGFSVIKTFRAERELLRLFSESNRIAERAKRHRNQIEILIQMLSVSTAVITQLGTFIVGGYLAATGRGITAGIMIVFVQLINFVILPIQEVPTILANRKAAFALIDKIAAALDTNVIETGKPIPASLAQGITLSHLSFGYEPEKPVLQNVSFTFESGKRYAIVGASGSGKSTLLNLLMAGSHSYDGQILFDGKELRDISVDSLYELESLIQQNVFVFNSTVCENITMFRDFPELDVSQAIERSGLSGFLRERGDGYLCGENGCELSGGERQRISIARALLRRTPVLLVDEATAALDRETAFHVTSSILNQDGLTRIVVTHSLDEALLRRYDCILTLKAGRLIESGSFADLMAQKGYFYSLYTVSQ